MNFKALPLIAVFLVILFLTYLILGTYKAVFLVAGVFFIVLGLLNFLRDKNKFARYVSSFLVNKQSISWYLILNGGILLLLLVL